MFLTGCPLRCAWCHNPEAFLWHGADADASRVRDVTVASLIRELERDIPYYDSSGGGVTLSGGEPLFQAAFALEVLDTCRRRDLHAALDTCGWVEANVLAAAAGLARLILYDLKAVDAAVHREWTGADNSRVLANLGLLENLPVPVWIRLPLIPGVNDDDENLERVIGLLKGTRFKRISLLPYHRIAEGKYQRLGLPNRMAGVAPPAAEHVAQIARRLAAAGFDPHIGS